MKIKVIKILILSTACTFFAACHREDFLQHTNESVKSINGTWQIIDVSRNGTDLLGRFDFSKFKITFSDSSYSIDNLVPFIVSQNGTYHLDDPQYPFKIYFNEQGDTTKKLDLNYPVTNGNRNIILTFSPGCSSNSYIYTLQKINQ